MFGIYLCVCGNGGLYFCSENLATSFKRKKKVQIQFEMQTSKTILKFQNNTFEKKSKHENE